MKGTISLNPKYSSLHIKPTKILKTNPLIACDQKNLYFKSTQKDSMVKSTRWQDKPIVNCTFLKRFNVILLLCENYRVYALTQNLQEITSITGWQSKYSLAFQYIDEYGILLMIGPENVQVIKVSIDTNIKKTKFLSSIKFNLKKLSSQPVILPSNIPWNKGYGINISENLLYVWSPEAIAFFQLSTHELLSESFGLTKKQHPITSCYFSPYYKYTITGTYSGEIRVWRLPLSKKFSHQNVLIHTFEAHVKAIKQIVKSKYSQKVILTSGQDLLVCVWSMQTFESLRRFDFFGIYTEVCVKSIDEAFVFKENVLGELSFGQSLDFITQVNSNILMVDKQMNISNDIHKSPTQNNEGFNDSSTISITLEQNLGIIFDKSLLLKAKQLNKIETKFIYPPLKAKSIKQIISSPFVSNDYYLLSQNGQIFRVVVPPFGKESVGVSSKIEQAFNVEFCLDRQKHPLNQLPTVIGFLDVLPTDFDSQIREVEDNGAKTHRITNEEKNLSLTQAIQKYNRLRLINIGCQKGTVIFVSCLQMTKIYCRLTYHREKILSIQSVKQYKSLQFNPMNGLVATYCAQNFLKIVKFNYETCSAQCLLTYYTGEDLKMIRGFDNYMAVVFYKGEFELSQIDLKGKTEEFCCRRPNMVENHQDEILSIDYVNSLQLVMTAACDNKIKIWTTKKILLYDILLDEGLMYSFFVPHFLKKQIKKQALLDDKKQKQNEKQKSGKKQTPDITNPIQIKLQQLRNRPKPIPVDFDMIILHGQKILYFHHIPISFRPNQIESFNSNPQLLDEQKITLKQVFESYSQRTIQLQQKSSPQMEKKQSIISNHQRQRIKTQPSYGQGKKIFNQEKIQNRYQQDSSPKFRKGKLKTEASVSFEQQKSQIFQQYRYGSTQKKKQKKPTVAKGRPSISAIKQVLYRPGLVSQSSIEATRRHIKQLQNLKKQINYNRPFLPKINQKKDDIFDQFMKEKLINKNVLTRRDITINRIIMKNIIREHFADESKMTGLRLDY